MWAKHKQSEIRMVRRNSTNASSDNCLYRWGEKFTFWNKFDLINTASTPDCNPNDQENSHKLQIRTASSKNRKVNFCLELKLTVNWSKWSRELAQGHVPITAFMMGREIISWKSLIRELAVGIRVCRIFVVIMTNVTRNITLNIPTFKFMSTACLSKFGTP